MKTNKNAPQIELPVTTPEHVQTENCAITKMLLSSSHYWESDTVGFAACLSENHAMLKDCRNGDFFSEFVRRSIKKNELQDIDEKALRHELDIAMRAFLRRQSDPVNSPLNHAEGMRTFAEQRYAGYREWSDSISYKVIKDGANVHFSESSLYWMHNNPDAAGYYFVQERKLEAYQTAITKAKKLFSRSMDSAAVQGLSFEISMAPDPGGIDLDFPLELTFEIAPTMHAALDYARKKMLGESVLLQTHSRVVLLNNCGGGNGVVWVNCTDL